MQESFSPVFSDVIPSNFVQNALKSINFYFGSDIQKNNTHTHTHNSCFSTFSRKRKIIFSCEIQWIFKEIKSTIFRYQKTLVYFHSKSHKIKKNEFPILTYNIFTHGVNIKKKQSERAEQLRLQPTILYCFFFKCQ